MDANEIRDYLKETLTTYEEGVEFFGRLGYADAADAPVPTREWAESVQRYGLRPVYMAQFGDFKIIYCELPGDRILRTVQRAVIEQLARFHDFFMVVFHNRGSGQNTWDFANVRVTQDEQTGRIRRDVRHITIGESERQRDRLYTASRRLARIDVNERQGISLLELQELHREAFDVEQVTKEFYEQYDAVFKEFVKDIERLNPSYAQDSDAQAQALLDRLMFLYFIQHKGWLNQQYDFLYSRFEPHADAGEATSYYQQEIVPLFLKLAIRDYQPNANEHVPFLNGGLFQFDTQHMVVHLRVSNRAFNFAFSNLFERYAFTVEEDMPDDRTVAIDPEMLGKVFESLILNREQDKDLRKSTGSYYTPRAIVSFMCQQSLREYIVQAWRDSYQASSPDGQLPVKMERQGGQGELRDFELDQDEKAYSEKILGFVEDGKANIFSADEARRVRDLLLSVRVIDPAVGSGAFLVGMLQEIIRLITLLDEHTEYRDTTAPNYAYSLKRDIIGKCLYGVDIQEEAVQICELRLWLSLVVDYEPQDTSQQFSQWIREVAPLPNLSYLVRQGNSLIEQVLGETVQFDAPQTAHAIGQTTHVIGAIQELKSVYYHATDPQVKLRIDREILSKQAELTRQLLQIQQTETNRQYEKKYRTALPGMERTLSRAEQREKDELLARIDHLRQLGNRADDIRRRAEALHSVDENVLRQLRSQLGAFIWRVDFGEVFAEHGGFDIAIANPPYIRQEKIKGQKPTFQRLFPEVYSGTADLYVYFYAQALRLLRPNGILTFISPNKFLVANYGKELRQHLGRNTTLQLLIDFGDLEVFEATTYPFITVTRRHPPMGDDLVRVLNVNKVSTLDMLTSIVRSSNQIPQSSLRSDGWQLIDRKIQDSLAKLRANGQSLGEYMAGRFYRGLITGLNEAFVIDSDTFTRLTSTDAHSRSVIKKWIRGRDVKRWQIDWAGLYVIAIQNGGDKGVNHPWSSARNEQEARRIFMETFPAIHDHLSQHEDALRKRYDKGEHWWELRACAYYSDLEASKIIYPDIAQRPSFALDTEGYFMGNTLYSIPKRDEFLLGVLNSNIIHFFYTHTSSQVRGGYLRFFTQYVEQIPIASATTNQRQKIEDIVRQILNPDTKRTNLKELERELNITVAAIYGLSQDEVSLIEETLNKEAVLKADSALSELVSLNGDF